MTGSVRSTNTHSFKKNPEVVGMINLHRIMRVNGANNSKTRIWALDPWPELGHHSLIPL